MSKRKTPGLNTSSMADISFLLLTFFLMTSSMNTDMGIPRRLPPPLPPDTKLPDVRERNIFVVKINSKDRVLFNGAVGDVNILKDRGTSYDMYFRVQNELAKAINELRNEWSQQKYGKKYADIDEKQRDAIDQAIPIAISEAEPTKIGGT